MSNEFNFKRELDGQWLASNASEQLLVVEKKLVAQCMPALDGLFAVQFSALNQRVVESSTLKHSFFLGTSAKTEVITTFEHLPFRPNSIDSTLLHHVLDYSINPHQCLRDAASITVPNGYLIIVGFNPVSIWGGLRLLRLNKGPFPVSLVTSRRVTDWLALLGFRVEGVSSAQVLPPITLKYFPNLSLTVDRLCKGLGFSMGGSYVVLARKLVAGRTPIRPQWGRITAKGNSVAAPAARGVPFSR